MITSLSEVYFHYFKKNILVRIIIILLLFLFLISCSNKEKKRKNLEKEKKEILIELSNKSIKNLYKSYEKFSDSMTIHFIVELEEYDVPKLKEKDFLADFPNAIKAPINGEYIINCGLNKSICFSYVPFKTWFTLMNSADYREKFYRKYLYQKYNDIEELNSLLRNSVQDTILINRYIQLNEILINF